MRYENEKKCDKFIWIYKSTLSVTLTNGKWHLTAEMLGNANSEWVLVRLISRNEIHVNFMLIQSSDVDCRDLPYSRREALIFPRPGIIPHVCAIRDFHLHKQQRCHKHKRTAPWRCHRTFAHLHFPKSFFMWHYFWAFIYSYSQAIFFLGSRTHIHTVSHTHIHTYKASALPLIQTCH